MRKLLYFIFVASLCVSSLPLNGKPILKMRTLTMLDGLLSNDISNFYAAPNGMMWIATWNGLCNYDGYRFNSFLAPMDKKRTLTSNRLRNIVVDDSNNVWLITVDRHLYLLDGKENKYVDYCETIGLRNFTATSLRKLDNGAVWILGSDGTNIRVHNGKHDITPTNYKRSEVCRKVVLTPDGSEWLMGERSTRRYGCSRSVNVKSKEAFSTQYGVMLIGEKIGVYDVKTDRFASWTLPVEMVGIADSKQLSDGTVCIASMGNLWILSGRKFHKFCALENDDIYKDKKDRLWTLAPGGSVTMIDVKRKKTERLPYTMPEGWPKLNISRNIVHEDQNGNVWLFMPQKPLLYYDEASRKLVAMDLRGISGMTDTGMMFSTIGSDHQHNLWINNMYSTSILSFNDYDCLYIPFVKNEETRAIIMDCHNRYWVATKGGHVGLFDSTGNLLGYVTSTGGLTTKPSRFSEYPIYTLFEDSRSRIWIGTRGGGLYLLEQGATQDKAFSPPPSKKGRMAQCAAFHEGA